MSELPGIEEVRDFWKKEALSGRATGDYKRERRALDYLAIIEASRKDEAQ